MIPKIIHYCWFGNKQIPHRDQEFMQGWKKILPDYKFMLWNEDNSLMRLPYMQKAYRNKKWANMSNFQRLQALHDYGGIYLDTDVEILRSLDPLLMSSCFLGFESVEEDKRLMVNNAVFGACPGNWFIKKCKARLLADFPGTEPAHHSSPVLVTSLLREVGLVRYGRQELKGISLFERECFYPYPYNETYRESCVTEDTYAVHHWSKSWWPDSRKKKNQTTGPAKSRVSFLKKAFPVVSYYNAIYRNYGILGLKLRRQRMIQNGPFQGMKYVSSKAKGSRLFPKLIGCYEEILHEAMYGMLDRNYRKIINIGSGEGYYAVGLAKLFPDSSVFAYDTNASAIKLVVANANANALSHRITANCASYEKHRLKEENFQERTLIFCDVEGHELDLFDEDSVPYLANVDLILELHDFLNPATKSRILALFGPTHVNVVLKQSTIPRTIYRFLRSHRQTKKLLNLFDEGRPEVMEWAVLYSKSLNKQFGDCGELTS